MRKPTNKNDLERKRIGLIDKIDDKVFLLIISVNSFSIENTLKARQDSRLQCL